MDTYSNILYVKEQFAALSHLAHRVAAADKYRPETCCIVGNYYSLKGQHEKVDCPFPQMKQQCMTRCNLQRYLVQGWQPTRLLHRGLAGPACLQERA